MTQMEALLQSLTRELKQPCHEFEPKLLYLSAEILIMKMRFEKWLGKFINL